MHSDLLTRRVAKILPSKKGLEALIKSKKKLRLYQGFDPTATSLHLGHTIGFRKLMDFARAGHEVIFLFGTGTVLAGDPSERDSGRKLITEAEIETNIKTWKEQVSKIVDFDLVKIKQNGDWLTKLTLKDIISIASHISAVQLFKREMFTRRLKAGDTVWYHETIYPLLQGYDSVVMDVDLEIGGTDQEFNMLIGRELQRKINGRDKFVLETPMINGLDGKKMSKSTGNCVFLTEPAIEIYRKIMLLADEQIPTYFELLTDIPMEEIKALNPDLPVLNKKRLAYEITKSLHGEKGAKDGQQYYDEFVSAKLAPHDTPTITIPPHTPILTTLKLAKLGVSNADLKRVLLQGGVQLDGVKITDLNAATKPGILKFGKNTFRKLLVK